MREGIGNAKLCVPDQPSIALNGTRRT